LPFSEINHLDGYTNSTERFGLLAATPEGLWLSSDDARSWRQLLPGACYTGCASPSGRLLLAAQTHEGLRLSEDGGDSWRDVPGPWQLGGRILACQVSDRRQIHLALLENMQESVSFWQGLPGEIEEVIRLPAPANPVVSLWTPPSALPDRPWYASLGSQVWKFSARRSGGRRNEVRINEVHLSGARAHSSLLPETERGEPIVALEGFQDSERIEIYASSGPRLYRSSDDAQTWTPVFDFGRRRVVSLSRLSPGSEARWMVLFLGGEIGILYE
jgi:hypothetical protein